MALDCIDYKGHVGNAGYGLDYDPETQMTVLAHRKAYKDFYGVLDKKLVVMHKCNNKKCINPEHLKQGTQSENVKQSYREGLQVNPHRKLTKEQVLEILSDTDSQRKIASKYNVSQTVIKNVKLKRSYCDLTGSGTCGS